MRILYCIYQVFVAFPVTIVMTIWTAILVGVGCALGNGHYWGYYPGRWWARAIVRAFLLPVKVEGRENLEPDQSYVFVANHQGAFDIFLIYGFLGRNFKWMMKYQIQQIPFVGYACRRSHQIMVDRRGVGAVRRTCVFRKGAFALADELQLPVVPLTINGSFDVMPRMKDWHFATWHPLTLTVHQPIYPVGQGTQNVEATMRQAYDSVMSALVPEYQGFVENPDQ